MPLFSVFFNVPLEENVNDSLIYDSLCLDTVIIAAAHMMESHIFKSQLLRVLYDWPLVCRVMGAVHTR